MGLQLTNQSFSHKLETYHKLTLNNHFIFLFAYVKTNRCFFTTSILLSSQWGKQLCSLIQALASALSNFFFTLLTTSEIVESEACNYAQKNNKQGSVLSLGHCPQLQ